MRTAKRANTIKVYFNLKKEKLPNYYTLRFFKSLILTKNLAILILVLEVLIFNKEE
jgi:hypothetical protein